MQRRNSPEHYGSIALAIHWLTVALVLIGWVLGAFGDALPRGSARATGLLADRAFARSAREVHEVLAHALVILAALHAAAAFAHHWVFRDRTLRRMLPWLSP